MANSRYAFIAIGLDQKTLDGSLKTGSRKMKGWAQRTGAELGRTFRGAMGDLASIAGLAGIAGLAAATKEVLEFETRLTRLQIQSHATAEEMGKLRATIFELAKSKGVDSSQILAGVEGFVTLTGDIKTATASLSDWVTISQATGASMSDITTTAAALSTNMGIMADGMKQAFGTMLVQGKAGAIELKDMAQQLSSLSPQFQQFATHGQQGVMELTAIMQVMRSGFASASETATGFSSLMTAVVKNAARLREVGVNPFQKDGKHLRDILDIVYELIAKSKGNPEVIAKVLGRAEAVQAILPMMQRGRAEVERFMNLSGTGIAEINADFATMMETPAAKVAKAKEQIKAVLNETLVKILPKVADAMQVIADAIGFIAEHSTEALAVFAMLKGGSMLGGLAGVISASGGAGGAGGGGGPGGMGGAVAGGLGRAGRAMQYGAAGYAVTQALAPDMNGITQEFVVLAHAAAALPGPFGMIGASIALASDAILLAAHRAEADIDERNGKIAKDDLGLYAMDRAKSFGDLGEGSTRQIVGSDGNIKTIGGEFDRNSFDASMSKNGGPSQSQIESATFFMNKGKNQGFIDERGNIDTEKLDKYIKENTTSMQPYEAQRLKNSFLAAQEVDAASGGATVAKPAGPIVFGQGELTPNGRTGIMNSPAAQMLMTALGAGSTPRETAAGAPNEGDYVTPHEAPVRVIVEVQVTDEGGIAAKVANDRKGRRK